MGFHSLSGKIGIIALLMAGFEFGGGVATASAQAVAQASSEARLIGVWYGEIENHTSAPGRVLAIKEDGTCYWGIYIKGKKTAWEKPKCKLDPGAGKVDLVTSAKSQVPLTLVDKDHLKGLFLAEYHGGFAPHSLQMRRIENPEQYR